MFEAFEVREDTPRDISRFEQLWALAITASAMIAVGMYDYSAEMVGHFWAILINAVLFAIGVVLMGFISRRQSGVARWLLIPFSLLIFFYDLSHFAIMLDREWIAYVAVARGGLMVGAIYFVFKPRARAWLAGHPLPPGGEDDDWS